MNDFNSNKTTIISESRIYTLFKNLLAIIIISVVLFSLIEGLSSLVLFVKDSSPISEANHTEPDALLGWISKPNLNIKNKYGKGVNFKTNSQRFRAENDTSVKVAKDKIRIICSGDSFTLGYGVDNADTWCHLLAYNDKRLETVNMGQGAYGIDQVYLWYERDGQKLDHQIQILAVIGQDFDRMQQEYILGYQKPVLDLVDNKLKVINYPVSAKAGSAIDRIAQASKNLRIISLVNKILEKFPSIRQNQALKQSPNWSEDKQKQIVKVMLSNLQKINQQKNSQLVVVYLPIKDDLTRANVWRFWLEQICKDLGINYFDMTPLWQKLPASEIEPLFIGHYSIAGNQYTAKLIWDYIYNQTSIKEKFTK